MRDKPQSAVARKKNGATLLQETPVIKSKTGPPNYMALSPDFGYHKAGRANPYSRPILPVAVPSPCALEKIWCADRVPRGENNRRFFVILTPAHLAMCVIIITI
ncbi:MAG: hypothetical protein ACYS83_01795 [Planctomycetota bacterium]